MSSIVERNLSPRWDEGFQFRIQKATKILLTVLHNDETGADQPMGKVSVPISSMVGKPQWYSLDTHGEIQLMCTIVSTVVDSSGVSSVAPGPRHQASQSMKQHAQAGVEKRRRQRREDLAAVHRDGAVQQEAHAGRERQKKQKQNFRLNPP